MERLITPYCQCQTPEEAYSVVKEKVPKALSKWNIKADIDWDDSSRQVTAKGKGFKMEMNFEEGQLVTEMDFSFPLSMLKKTIIPSLEGELKKYL